MTEEATAFLDALFDGKPPNAAIQVWFKGTKKTHTFAAPAAAVACAQAVGNRDDAYISAGLGPKLYQKPQGKRGMADEVVGIPGVWADIDVNGGPEGKTGAAPSLEQALELAHSILDPTILVNSGYGLQAWWLFEGGPWIFSGPDGREQQTQAARLVHAFQMGLRVRARRWGWGIDPTHDLARLMRMPGTFNCKGRDHGFDPVPTSIYENDGPRHSLLAVTATVQEHMGAVHEAIRRTSGDGIDIELRGQNAQPPLFKLEELMQIDTEFAVVWNHKPVPKTRGWSMNEFEMSIANYVARAGFSDQEMADTLVYHRLRHGDPKNKANRLDYITATIGKARQGLDIEEEEAELRYERQEAAEQLAALPTAGAVDPARASLLFSKVIGGPEIRELIQDGRDPDTARFRLVLADGRDVPIGAASSLLDFGRFRERYMVVTQHVPQDIKRVDWIKIVQAMIVTATINDEDTRSARIRGLIELYVDRGLSTDRNGACTAMDPWEDDYRVYVHAGQFTQWLRKVQGERLIEADVRQLLTSGGFERRTVPYVSDDGRKNSRSYWFIDRGDLLGEMNESDSGS